MNLRVITLAAGAAILALSAYALRREHRGTPRFDIAQCESLARWYESSARRRDRGFSEAIQERMLKRATPGRVSDWAGYDADRAMHVGIAYAYSHPASTPAEIYRKAYLSCATIPTGETVVRL